MKVIGKRNDPRNQLPSKGRTQSGSVTAPAVYPISAEIGPARERPCSTIKRITSRSSESLPKGRHQDHSADRTSAIRTLILDVGAFECRGIQRVRGLFQFRTAIRLTPIPTGPSAEAPPGPAEQTNKLELTELRPTGMLLACVVKYATSAAFTTVCHQESRCPPLVELPSLES
jgi:hypothetical protein